MNLALQSLAALTAGASMLVLAPSTSAQSSAHGIELVTDGANPLGPLHGNGQGEWIAPALQEGNLSAKLYDSAGVQRFTLDATLTEYLFFVAAPAQGEIYGQLLIPYVMQGRGVALALSQIYATVEGSWIETSHGRGAFTASILVPNDGPDGPVQQIGLIQGTFQFVRAAGRIQTSEAALSTLGPDASAGSMTDGMRHAQPAPLPIVVFPSPLSGQAHGMQLVGDGSGPTRERRRPQNNHGGLGHVGQGSGSGGSGVSGIPTAAPASQARALLRWELFE